jgi:transposase
MKKLAWAGLDVHQDSISISIVDNREKIIYEGRCNSDANELVKIFKKLKGYKLACCYEAGGGGFHLQRKLESGGYECTVIAPSLIPKKSGERVKTDKRDALKLAKYLKGNLLTAINIPTQEEEMDRNLVRARDQLVQDVKRIKLQILSICRANSWNYRLEIKKIEASYWTSVHRNWLSRKIKTVNGSQLEFVLSEKITRLGYLDDRVKEYDRKIEALSKEKRYSEKVKHLCCFRGIKTLSAMTIITELGDVRRFGHPRPLMAYLGFGIRENSSGNRRIQGSLTKTGNSNVRRILMESVQYAGNPFLISRDLKERRKDVRADVINIADKCLNRLRNKYWCLHRRGKHTNKIKGAVAREMVGFIWDVLRISA